MPRAKEIFPRAILGKRAIGSWAQPCGIAAQKIIRN